MEYLDYKGLKEYDKKIKSLLGSGGSAEPKILKFETNTYDASKLETGIYKIDSTKIIRPGYLSFSDSVSQLAQHNGILFIFNGTPAEPNLFSWTLIDASDISSGNKNSSYSLKNKLNEIERKIEILEKQ